MRRHIHIHWTIRLLLLCLLSFSAMKAAAPLQGNGYSISIPSIADPGAFIPITWSKPAGASSGFFGLYKATNFSNFIAFTFPAQNANSGTAQIQVPTEPGGYWIGWVADGQLKTSAFFQVFLPETA